MNNSNPLIHVVTTISPQKMGRASHLSSGEIAVVRAHADDDKTITEIATRLHRSATAVRNVLSKSPMHRVQEKRGRPRKISSKLVRALRRKARTGNYNARELRCFFELDCTVRRVQQLLNEDPRLSWNKMRNIPFMKKHHREARKKFAENLSSKTTGFWRSVVFLDKKSLIQTDPIGTHSTGLTVHWTRVTFRAEGKEEGVTIWGAFSKRGTAALVYVKGKMESDEYMKVLEKSLLPFVSDKHVQHYLLQQDNTRIHTSNQMRDWFLSNTVDVVE